VFAGMGLSLTAVFIPVVLICKDLLLAFGSLYNLASKVSIGSIIFANGICIVGFINTGDPEYLAMGGTSLLLALFILLHVKPTIEKLFRVNCDTPIKDVQQLVLKCSQLVIFRTAAGIGIFIYTVYKFDRNSISTNMVRY